MYMYIFFSLVSMPSTSSLPPLLIRTAGGKLGKLHGKLSLIDLAG